MTLKTLAANRMIHVAVVAGSSAVARACIDAFDGVADCNLLAVITSAGGSARAIPLLGPDVIVIDGASGPTNQIVDVPVVFLGFSGKGRPDGAVVHKAEHLPAAVRHAAHEANGHNGNGVIKPSDEPLATLSRREREVVELIVQSYSYKEIAGRLGVGVSTIGTHMHHIYQKLGVNSRREIVEAFRRRAVTESAFDRASDRRR